MASFASFASFACDARGLAAPKSVIDPSSKVSSAPGPVTRASGATPSRMRWTTRRPDDQTFGGCVGFEWTDTRVYRSIYEIASGRRAPSVPHRSPDPMGRGTQRTNRASPLVTALAFRRSDFRANYVRSRQILQRALNKH